MLTWTVAFGSHDIATKVFSFTVNLFPVTAITATVSLHTNPTDITNIALPTSNKTTN